MGNQQSKNGLEFCSARRESDGEMSMVDKVFRIEYFPSESKNIQLTEPEQWRNKLQGKQDKFCSVNENQDSENSEVSSRHQQHMMDSNQRQESSKDLMSNPLRSPELLKEMNNIEAQVKNGDVLVDTSTFEGIFGRITLLVNRNVEFTNNTGDHLCETYDPENIQKTFPMGISIRGLSKTLWFKFEDERDACYDKMTETFPTLNPALMANPEPSIVPNKTSSKKKIDSSNIKVFTGITGKVYVDKDSKVEYSDYSGRKYCTRYIKNEIKKCFPYGICFGGLTKTIWLTNETERDMCFTIMIGVEEVGLSKANEKTFPGLYGRIVLTLDCKVIFTSLIDERLTSDWDDQIRRVFPMGISGGGLLKTIWFREMEDLENCFFAMKQMLKN